MSGSSELTIITEKQERLFSLCCTLSSLQSCVNVNTCNTDQIRYSRDNLYFSSEDSVIMAYFSESINETDISK